MTYTDKERKDKVHEAVFRVACAELYGAVCRPTGGPPGPGDLNLKAYIRTLREEIEDMEGAYLLVHGHPCDMVCPECGDVHSFEGDDAPVLESAEIVVVPGKGMSLQDWLEGPLKMCLESMDAQGLRLSRVVMSVTKGGEDVQDDHYSR